MRQLLAGVFVLSVMSDWLLSPLVALFYSVDNPPLLLSAWVSIKIEFHLVFIQKLSLILCLISVQWSTRPQLSFKLTNWKRSQHHAPTSLQD